MSMEKKYCEGLSGAGEGLLLDVLPFLRFFGNKTYKTLCEARNVSNELWGHYLPKLKVRTRVTVLS